MNYDVVIVGGGMAGLTSAAYLSKDGYSVLVCEKENKVGGLVNSFDFKGFKFDGGIRAFENSGIVFPMLRQLGLEIDFHKNNVSIGIEDEVISVENKGSLYDYEKLLKNKFPNNKDDINKIIEEIKKVMKYMDILYGIDNPLFLDMKEDKEYLLKTILPWTFKYLLTIRKILKLNDPIHKYLENFSKNQSLINMIDQHFFKNTPAFFALSYFSLYLDYQYPTGGTSVIVEKMEELILKNKGEIRKDTQISSVNIEGKEVTDLNGNKYGYKKLIWATDLKKLYSIIEIDSIKNNKIKNKVIVQKTSVSNKIGGDSIFTMFLTLDMDKSFFEKISNAHMFYTPIKKGIYNIDINSLKNKSSIKGEDIYTTDKGTIIKWLKNYFDFTTYEISCPVQRDPNLAPEGKTGLIISTLMEYSLVKHIKEMGWYEEYKEISQDYILSILDSAIYKGMKDKVIDKFSSTPLTLERMTGNSEGAITGWAFTNSPIPVVSKLPQVAKSVLTPLPDVFQAGQWSFSPSGLPISILTGKLASDKVKKQL